MHYLRWHNYYDDVYCIELFVVALSSATLHGSPCFRRGRPTPWEPGAAQLDHPVGAPLCRVLWGKSQGEWAKTSNWRNVFISHLQMWKTGFVSLSQGEWAKTSNQTGLFLSHLLMWKTVSVILSQGELKPQTGQVYFFPTYWCER